VPRLAGTPGEAEGLSTVPGQTPPLNTVDLPSDVPAPTDEAKTPWLPEAMEWKTLRGVLIPSLSTVTWQDEGTPWVEIEVE